jgi:hypothetical protein
MPGTPHGAAAQSHTSRRRPAPLQLLLPPLRLLKVLYLSVMIAQAMMGRPHQQQLQQQQL